jgi:predicted metal-binding membrane protein
LAVWSLFGVVAYLLSLIVPAIGMAATGLRADSPMAAGIVLGFAGLYQLSPLKRICLHHCRSPLAALMHHWRDGRGGALRMGVSHGAYCLGCCWGLMLVLFAVGLMNVGWMLALTVVIFAEKVLPYGELVSKLTAIALVCFGLATLATALMPMAAG